MNGTSILIEQAKNIIEESLNIVHNKYLFEVVTPEIQDFFLKKIIELCEQKLHKQQKQIDLPLTHDDYIEIAKYTSAGKPWIFEDLECSIDGKEEIINLHIYHKGV